MKSDTYFTMEMITRFDGTASKAEEYRPRYFRGQSSESLAEQADIMIVRQK